MRTAIYVHQSTTVTIQARDPAVDRGLVIRSYRQPAATQLAGGGMTLERGIYLIASTKQVFVDGGNITVETTTEDKDTWPVPKLTVLELEPGASLKSVQEFFAIAKGVDD